MSKTFFVADPHLRHEFVARDRGYASVEDHDHDFVQSWRGAVGPSDEAWVLGDLTVGSYFKVEPILDALPGRKYLVLGNHEAGHPMHRSWRAKQDRYREVFDWVGTDASVRLEGRKVRLNHLPHQGEHARPDGTYAPDRHSEWRPGLFDGVLVHGHVHKEWKAVPIYHGSRKSLLQINVGWDIWKRPVRGTELVELMKEYGK